MQGYKGKYFSLAAILALSASIALGAQAQAIVDTEKSLSTPKENAEAVEVDVLEEDSQVVVISKKVKAKKSKVYSASKQNVSKTNVTDNVSVITSEEMELRGITTVTDALDSLPGVYISPSGGLGQSTQVYLQGFSNKYTLLLVDGVRYNDPTNTSGADFSHLLLDDVERIEVIKGAQSGVWGADAAAGVVNIITKKAEPGTHGSVRLEIGSYGHKELATSLSHRTQTFDISASLSRVTEDGFTAIAPVDEDIDQYEDDSYRNTTVNVKAGYWIDASNRIEAGYHDINSLINYDDFSWTGAPLPDAEQASDYRAKSGYLKYKYYIKRHLLEATLSQSYFHNQQLNATFGINDSKGTTPAFEVKDTMRYGNDNSLVFGGSYEKREVKYTQIGSSQESESGNNKALFVNNTYRAGDVILTQALRYDDVSDYDSKVTGKLGVKYLFDKDINVYANYGTGYKAPNIMDMINIWGTSNFDLQPEEVKSMNMGVEYKGLGINLFRNEIDEMISWDTTTNQNVNISGTSTLKGVEINYERMVYDRVLLGTNYTYVDAKDADGNRLLRRPRYQVGANVSFNVINDVRLSIDGTYIGFRKDTDYETSNSVDTGRYFVANTKVDYKINKAWSVYVKVNNLFNKEYQNVYNYAASERSYYLGVQAKF